MSSFPNIEQKLIFDVKNGKSIFIFVWEPILTRSAAFSSEFSCAKSMEQIFYIWPERQDTCISILAFMESVENGEQKQRKIQKCKYLGSWSKYKKSGQWIFAHENSEENAIDCVRIGPQTKMKIDFPFSRKTVLENQVFLNIRRIFFDIGFFFFFNNFFW